jgi:hypothetical protein
MVVYCIVVEPLDRFQTSHAVRYCSASMLAPNLCSFQHAKIRILEIVLLCIFWQ